MKNLKKALLVIDIQNDFTSENAKMPVDKKQGIQMIKKINRLINRSLEESLIVVYIGNEYSKFDFLNIFRNFAAIKNTEGSRQDDRLQVINENYFPKKKGNSFSNPELDKFLKSEQITELFISGLMAEHCVYQTVKGAIKRQYSPIILTDCIATKTDKKLLKAIEKYKEMGIELKTSEQVF